MVEEAVTRIEHAYRALGHSLGWRFLYSPRNTLSAATPLLLVGLNPGGKKHHTSESVEEGNAYRLEKWGKKDSWNPLQVQVGRLFEVLAPKLGQASPDVLMDTTLTSNFCPFRSPSWKKLHEPEESVQFSHELWSWLLPQLSPSAIICLSSDCSKHFRKVLLSLGGVEHQLPPERTEWGDVTYTESHIKHQGRDILMLQLPHLSTYKLFSRAECVPAVERFTDALAHAVIANSKVSPLSMSDARSRAEDGKGGSQRRSPGTAASSSLGHRGQIGLELDQEILQRLRENG